MPSLRLSDHETEALTAFLMTHGQKKEDPGVETALKDPTNISAGESLVRKYFPNMNPLGQHIQVGIGDGLVQARVAAEPQGIPDGEVVVSEDSEDPKWSLQVAEEFRCR